MDSFVHPEMFLLSLRDTSGEKLVWLPRFWYFTDNSVEAQIQWRFIAFVMRFVAPWFLPILLFVLALVARSQGLARDCGSSEEECMGVKECPEWSTRIEEGLTVSQRKRLSKAICGFQGSEPKVCSLQ